MMGKESQGCMVQWYKVSGKGRLQSSGMTEVEEVNSVGLWVQMQGEGEES